jgi:membrane-associated protease RseP (regulator of RpoE activity)
VAAWKFRDPRRGMALVACAGPAMNFFLAWVAALLLPAPQTMAGPGVDYLDAAIGQSPVVGTFLFYFMLTNLVLGLFNLLPIPPLDGGHLAFYGLEALIGRPVSERAMEMVYRVGFLMVIGFMGFVFWNDLFGC